MSDGVYRKTSADVHQHEMGEGNTPEHHCGIQPDQGEVLADTRITAVIKDGTIQVGYTPVVETLAATLPHTRGGTAQTGEDRVDLDTSPGFRLASAIAERQGAEGANTLADLTLDGGSAEPVPQDGVGTGPNDGLGTEMGADAKPAGAAVGVTEKESVVDLLKTGTHPRVVLLIMTLISWGGYALYWGHPMVNRLRLAQSDIAVLAFGLVLGVAALWFGRAQDRWGPVPFSLGTAITATTLIYPVMNYWLGGPGLGDVMLYHQYGDVLLNTGYIPMNPAPEYPPLAVWTFGLIAWLTRTVGTVPALSTALVMALPGLVLWVILGRSQHAWMAAFIGLLPWSIMWQVIRFDMLPTVLLVAALLVIRPEKEATSGRVLASALLFGLAAAAKWHPGLAAIVLFFGFLGVKAYRQAIIMCLGSIVGFVAPQVPWLFDASGRQAILDAYLFHAARGVTGESLIWQFLYPLGMAGKPGYAWDDSPDLVAGVWPTVLVIWVIVLVIAIAFWRPHVAWSAAVMAPALWLMANRIFSVQFVLTITVLWIIALTYRKALGRGWRILILASLAILNSANWMIWPVINDRWPLYSAITFAFLVPMTVLMWIMGSRAERQLALDGGHRVSLEAKA